MDTIKTIPVLIDNKINEFLENLETCCLCGSKLQFHHQTNYLHLRVTEQATCTECGIKNKAVDHVLQ